MQLSRGELSLAIQTLKGDCPTFYINFFFFRQQKTVSYHSWSEKKVSLYLSVGCWEISCWSSSSSNWELSRGQHPSQLRSSTSVQSAHRRGSLFCSAALLVGQSRCGNQPPEKSPQPSSSNSALKISHFWPVPFSILPWKGSWFTKIAGPCAVRADPHKARGRQRVSGWYGWCCPGNAHDYFLSTNAMVLFKSSLLVWNASAVCGYPKAAGHRSCGQLPGCGNLWLEHSSPRYPGFSPVFFYSSCATC